MEQAQPDRRSEQRYAVDAEATVVMVNHGSSLRGRLIELSLEGCRMRADRHYALDAPASIEVIFKINGIDFRLGGTMQWADALHMAGIRFGAMAPRRRDFLMELLSELAVEEAAKDREAAEGATENAPENVESREKNIPHGPEPNSSCGTTEVVPGFKTAYAADFSGRKEEAPKADAAGVGGPSWPAPAEPEIVSAAAPGPPPMEAAPAGRSAAPASRRERRAQARLVVDSRATIFFVDVRANIVGRILDVSLGGCRIRTNERFPVGIYRRVETEFTVDGVPLRLGGVVQSLHDRFTVGIRFLDMSERKRNQLTELIEEIEALKD